MHSVILALLIAASQLAAQERQIPIVVDSHPYATFFYGDEHAKPYVAPLRSASGKIVTRRFPMQEVPGESRDHVHHTGLWFSCDEVNGFKFWGNDPSFHDPLAGRISVASAHYDGASNTLTARMEWRDPSGSLLLTEDRKMVFGAGKSDRTIDVEITLTAARDVTFGDTKEGAFAIRLADNFTEKNGATMIDSQGRRQMANVWGKRADWVDYTAIVEGETIGVAIFDHPLNPRHPTYWHARDYGLFAANPFGRKAFDPAQPESRWALPAGAKLVFRYRVLIHGPGMDLPGIYRLYR